MKWFWLMLSYAALMGCSGRDVAGGSTVETDNALSAQVLAVDGKPIRGAFVHIRPTWFVADTGIHSQASTFTRDLQTDSLGWIYTADLPVGSYTIEIQYQGQGALLYFDKQDTSSSDTLAHIDIQPLGSIEGQVHLNEDEPYAWIQIYGLNRAVKTDSLGFFTMDSLPASILHIRAVTSQQSSAIATDYIQVHSGYTWNVGVLSPSSIFTEDLKSWRYSKEIPINALFSDWMEPLSDPTVGILRLDSTNFDFTQAMSDGRDVRFFDASGKRLIFQRASWNAEQKMAVIRIRLQDYSASSHIIMFWGCNGAVDPSIEGLWNGISDSLYQELYTVHVSDFESNSLISNMPPPISPHSWYLRPQDSSVQMLISTDSAILGIQPAGYGRTGNAYHIANIASPEKWTLLGIHLDTFPKNFEHLDSVVFWVRGTGTYHFAIESLTDINGKAIYKDTLDTVWTRKCIQPQDFIAPDNIGGNIGWSAIQFSVTTMTFFAYGNADFWLDDIRLFGLNRDDLK